MATFMDVRPPVWLSFPRIVDVPFETCVATLESWQRAGQDGGLHIGQGVLRWPIEHDREHGTCRVEVGLARGPLRPPLRMRLEIDRWSPSRTALELIPTQPARPAADYFRSGHLLMDALTRSLLRRRSSVEGAPEICENRDHEPRGSRALYRRTG